MIKLFIDLFLDMEEGGGVRPEITEQDIETAYQ